MSFVLFEVVPLLVILHMLFKELGVNLFYMRYFRQKKSDTGATNMIDSASESSEEQETFEF